jgi:hypothetical protein
MPYILQVHKSLTLELWSNKNKEVLKEIYHVVLYIFIIHLDYRIKMLQDTSMPKRMYIFMIFIILQCLNYDVQLLILFWLYYDCTNKSFKCYVIQPLLCIKGSAIMYHAKFSLISNEIASFIRFNIDALQFCHVKASVTWFSIAMN